MKAKEQFALVLRVVGVLGLVYLLRQSVRHHDVSAGIMVLRIICAIIGIYLLRGAPLLLRFAYPECACADKKASA